MKYIGQYRVVATLGKGGMGMVHLGEHVLLGRRAAVKTLLPALSAQPEIVERFFTEARATAKISDPGIVQVFDFGYHVDGTAYIVMELLEGEALFDRMIRVGPLPVGHALRIVRQVASALAATHAAGVIHRDLKPENIFIVADPALPDGERVKLLDFGICKMTADDVRHTAVGVMLGTPVYMSPEQCRGSLEIDGRADLYALGGVLFHMLTDHTVFEATSSGEYVAAHLTTEAPAPSTRRPTISPAVDAIVLRCLAKDPADRFASMQELLQAIDKALVQLGHEEAVARAPRVMRLASGFKSNYDANIDAYTPGGTREVRSVLQPVDLHVTKSPITVSSNRATWRTIGKVTIGAVLTAVAVALGLIAWNVVDDEHADASVAVSPPSSPSPTPVAAPAPAPAPAPVAVVAPTAIPIPIPIPTPTPIPPPPPKPIPRARAQAPISHRPTPPRAAQVGTSPSSQDLYDTR